MFADVPATGLLVMRVEQQDEYLLITVTTEHWRRIDCPPDQQLRLTDPAEALRVVAAFLDSF
jgi:hypothetical protein